MIAGLIKSDARTNVKRFPGLGDIPILGALFRSSEFQKDKTELMFVITPRLVKPLPPDYALPTDTFVEPRAQISSSEERRKARRRPDAHRNASTRRLSEGGFENR